MTPEKHRAIQSRPHQYPQRQGNLQGGRRLHRHSSFKSLSQVEELTLKTSSQNQNISFLCIFEIEHAQEPETLALVCKAKS